MEEHKYDFVKNYDGIGAFGWDRNTDEDTLKYYLQKFAEDSFMEILVPRLKDGEIQSLYDTINLLLHKHLSEPEYHRHFLKDGTH